MTEGVGMSDSQISPARRWAITLSVRIAALREQDQRRVSWRQRVLIEPVVPQDLARTESADGRSTPTNDDTNCEASCSRSRRMFHRPRVPLAKVSDAATRISDSQGRCDRLSDDTANEGIGMRTLRVEHVADSAGGFRQLCGRFRKFAAA